MCPHEYERGRTSPKHLSKSRPKIAKRTSLSLFVSGSLILRELPPKDKEVPSRTIRPLAKVHSQAQQARPEEQKACGLRGNQNRINELDVNRECYRRTRGLGYKRLGAATQGDRRLRHKAHG